MIGKKVKELREKRGRSLSDTAREIGVSKSYLSTVENGKTKPSSALIKKICDHFSVSEADLGVTEAAAEIASAPKMTRGPRGAKKAESAQTKAPGKGRRGAAAKDADAAHAPAHEPVKMEPAVTEPVAADPVKEDAPKTEHRAPVSRRRRRTETAPATTEHKSARTASAHRSPAHHETHRTEHAALVEVDTAPYAEIRDRARKEGPTMPSAQKEEIAEILRRALRDIEA